MGRERLGVADLSQDSADALPRVLPVLRGRRKSRWARLLSRCQLYQRSATTSLGVPFQHCQLCAVSHMVAVITDLDG